MAELPMLDQPAAEAPADVAPASLHVGAINPRALTEAILGKKVDWSDPASIRTMTDTLDTDYNELFDMKFNSPIYAGLKLGSNNIAVPLTRDEMTILTPRDRCTPNLGAIKNTEVLKNIGVDITSSNIKHALVNKGKLNLVLEAPLALNKKITNTSVTQQIVDIATPFRPQGVNFGWTPPPSTWRDMGTMLETATDYEQPIQGALGDCWLIAALAAVAWADPYSIVHRNRPTSAAETDSVNGIQFYSKPPGRDAPTKMVDVTDKTLVDCSSLLPLYCRCSDPGEIWPLVYEKAFAKWSTQNTTDEPDITTLYEGDAGKAMAQINGKNAIYYNTASRTPEQLWGIVRENSLSFKTINPMTAWTYSSGSQYNGSNIVANHAYTVLGWAYMNSKEYIVLRNPWGFLEPSGLNTYQGLVTFFDNNFWHPINTIGDDGVFALEAPSFKFYYETLAVAK